MSIPTVLKLALPAIVKAVKGSFNKGNLKEVNSKYAAYPCFGAVIAFGLSLPAEPSTKDYVVVAVFFIIGVLNWVKSVRISDSKSWTDIN